MSVFYYFEYSFLFLLWLVQLLNWVLEFLQSYFGLHIAYSGGYSQFLFAISVYPSFELLPPIACICMSVLASANLEDFP